jgi:glycosyltransferase 2 family protein
LLVQGVFQGVIGWCILAVSLSLAIRAVVPDSPEFTGKEFVANLAAVALSYVAGLVILVAPGGLGVREYVMAKIIMLRWIEADGPVLAEAQAVMVAILVRLAWTIFEVALAGVLWLNDRRSRNDAAA